MRSYPQRKAPSILDPKRKTPRHHREDNSAEDRAQRPNASTPRQSATVEDQRDGSQGRYR
jgi:hypothetical protein